VEQNASALLKDSGEVGLEANIDNGS